jgi:hypothetical protein
LPRHDQEAGTDEADTNWIAIGSPALEEGMKP